ncbi:MULTISPECIES: amidohydrolase family protein [unclassified Oscillibacter]|uniref:amidohydrolase family protein n=1 Tax=unclassified Oscillibacter TaxID=2629304 RepID=UPI0025E4330A|nr:amidohydrolase family protein [Oscillibacter sp. UBA6647]
MTDAYHGLPYRDAEYAVKGATVNAAKMCRIDRRTSSIQPGLAADLIAVDGNPPENISSLSRVSFVMKQGRIFKKGAAGIFPTAPNCVMKSFVLICFTRKSISRKYLIRSCKHGQLPFL